MKKTDTSADQIASLKEELGRARQELADAKAQLKSGKDDRQKRQHARKRSREMQRLEEIELLLEFDEVDEMPAEQRKSLEEEREKLRAARKAPEQIVISVADLSERWDRVSRFQEDLIKVRGERDAALAEIEELKKRLTEELGNQEKDRWTLVETERRLREAREELDLLKNELSARSGAAPARPT